MNPVVKKDILNVLRQALEIIDSGEIYKLREISDHVIHNASIFQDKYSITIAVLIYSLSKIYRAGKVDSFVKLYIRKAITAMESGDLNLYEKSIKSLVSEISRKDKNTTSYVEQVLERAQIKKASKMFEHGISLGQVAESLGISLWDIMDYVGKTRIIDEFEHKTNIKEKIVFAREIFNLK